MSNPAAVALGSIKSAKKAAAAKRNGLRVPQKYSPLIVDMVRLDVLKAGKTITAAAEAHGMSRRTVSRMVRGVYLRKEGGQ